jgi:hypothetical protein
MIQNKEFDLVINTPCSDIREEEKSGYFIRRIAVDKGIGLITNSKVAKTFIESLFFLEKGEKINILAYKELTKK